MILAKFDTQKMPFSQGWSIKAIMREFNKNPENLIITGECLNGNNAECENGHIIFLAFKTELLIYLDTGISLNIIYVKNAKLDTICRPHFEEEIQAIKDFIFQETQIQF